MEDVIIICMNYAATNPFLLLLLALAFSWTFSHQRDWSERGGKGKQREFQLENVMHHEFEHPSSIRTCSSLIKTT